MSFEPDPSPWRAVVAAVDLRVRKRLDVCLTELGIRFEVVSSGDLSRIRPKPTVYCVGSRYLDRTQAAPGPTVLVASGAAIVDTVLLAAARPQVVAMRLADLTPKTLLDAIMAAVLGSSQADLVDELLEAVRATGLPRVR